MTQVRRIGFTQLQGKTGVKEEVLYRSNIVLVHGLRGHPRYTWESGRVVNTNHDQTSTPKNRTGFRSLFKSKPSSPNPSPSQPQDITSPLNDIPNARIWTYGYNADVIGGLFQASNKNSVSQHGRDLKAKIEREIDNDDPIVFIVHSLGGIIVKDMLHRSEACQQRTKLIIFLGTPHRGSSYSEWDQIASNLASLVLQDSSKRVIQTLEVNSEVLDNIHEEFKTIVHSRNIKVHSFQEGKGIVGMKGLHNKVVDDFSPKLDLPQWLETVESIDANHMEMARCSSKDDERYRAISGVLRQFLRSDALAGSVSKAQEIPKEVSATGGEVDGKPDHAVYHVIYFAKNRRYIQRAESFDIQRMFFDQKRQTVALVGMGGVGKTQLALEFAYWVKENKPACSVFWVPALSYAGFEQAYTDIAKELGLRPNTEGEDIKTTVRQFLNSKAAGRWLLIIDNADDMNILFGSAEEQNGLINHLPTSDNGIILFTTRSKEVALAVADDALIDLPAMDKDKAEALLGNFVHRKQLLQDHDAVAELLDFLTYLPLAITQASAYVNRNTTLSIRRYLQLLQGTEDTLISTISREFRDNTRYSHSSNAIATTWLVSFEQIRHIDSYAADLLYFISQIEPKSIPRSILPCSGSEEELEYAIGTLSSYAFLVEREETQTFDMHSLIHLGTRIWVAKQSIDQRSKENAIDHLNKIFPTDDYTNRPLWRQYMPHALKVLKESVEAENDEVLDLYSQVGRCLLEDARTKEAIRLLEHVMEVEEKTLDEGHPDRLASQHELARAYQADGRTKEAMQMRI